MFKEQIGPKARGILWPALGGLALLLACGLWTTHAKKPHKRERDLNKRFFNPKRVKTWKKRFERESREVFRHRVAIVGKLGLKKGQMVADIGAGTGAYMKPFLDAVGPKGWYYGVELSPAFVRFLKKRAKAKGYKNVKVLKSTAKKTHLAANSMDLIFTCDTYHHFDDAPRMLADIRRALRPGGRFVIVDFKRIPGVSKKWILSHVKQGQAKTTAEVLRHGFKLEKEIKMSQLKENYFLIFRSTKKRNSK